MGTHQPAAHRLLFWTLATMGIAAAVPCFLVPSIEAYHRLLEVERREQALTQHLTDLIEQQDRLCEAIRTDPQVNTRLAMRELGRRPTGQQVQYLASGGLPETANVALAHIDNAAEPPAWIDRLYPARWAFVYRNPRARHIILALSVLLVLAALEIYKPQKGSGAF